MIKLLKIIVRLFRKFGFRPIYLIIPLYRFIYFNLYHVGFFLDKLFFRKYKSKLIHKPVFLIGHPRSGTTFLHKFFIKNCSEFEGMYLWRMIFPTLTARFLIKPFLPFINRIFPKNLYDPNIHKTGFLEPETDDVALFFRSFEGMFEWLYFSSISNYSSNSHLEADLLKTCKIDPVLQNLKIVFQKNLYKSKKNARIFSKSFSLILDFKAIINSFHGAKIIILIRDPLEVIPSSLSLARNVQDKLNGFKKLPMDKKKDYYRNLYYASIVFYKYLVGQITQGASVSSDYILISYNELIADFEMTLEKILHYCEIEKTSELAQAIKKQSEKQASYKGKHIYTHEEFGFTKEEVLRDFDFVYSTFNF